MKPLSPTTRWRQLALLTVSAAVDPRVQADPARTAAKDASCVWVGVPWQPRALPHRHGSPFAAHPRRAAARDDRDHRPLESLKLERNYRLDRRP
jgi:hypothetical protein